MWTIGFSIKWWVTAGYDTVSEYYIEKEEKEKEKDNP